MSCQYLFYFSINVILLKKLINNVFIAEFIWCVRYKICYSWIKRDIKLLLLFSNYIVGNIFFINFICFSLFPFCFLVDIFSVAFNVIPVTDEKKKCTPLRLAKASSSLILFEDIRFNAKSLSFLRTLHMHRQDTTAVLLATCKKCVKTARKIRNQK